jgi:hypothetical protein
MSNDIKSKKDPAQLMIYQIRIKGHLGRQWIEWFGGMAITTVEDGETLITGPVADQAALHGLLKKIRDLGTPLISVIRVNPNQTDTPGALQ